MNTETLKGNWKQWKGQMKKQWGKLTDNDIRQAEGSYDRLVGKIQSRYGYKLEEARKEVDRFFDKISN